MSVTDELNQWIAEHGSERDALNVALARLHLAEAEVERLNAEADSLTVALAEEQDAKAHVEREYLAFVMEAVGHEFTEPS